MNNSPINSTINSTTVVELADASSLRRLQFRRLNWNSLKGDQGKVAPNPIVY